MTAITTVRIALVGAGLIGRSHAKILAGLDPTEARFAAIVDPHPDAHELAAQYGVACYADLVEMLDREKPDAAIIATPNTLHGPQAHACIDRGVGLLVEKPLAEDFTTAKGIADHAERSEVPLLVGHFRRHNPVVKRAREMIQSGQLGRLVTVSASSTVLKPDPYYETAWRRQKGGGPVLINLVHDIDALRFLCGEIETVHAIASSEIRGFPVEDTAAVLLRFANGALATLVLSDATPSPFCWDQTAGENSAFPKHAADAYRISGTEATLELPSLTLWRYPDKRGWNQTLSRETFSSAYDDPLKLQISHFLRVIRREEAPLVSGDDGARTIAATNAVIQAATRNAPVSPEGSASGAAPHREASAS